MIAGALVGLVCAVLGTTNFGSTIGTPVTTGDICVRVAGPIVGSLPGLFLLLGLWSSSPTSNDKD